MFQKTFKILHKLYHFVAINSIQLCLYLASNCMSDVYQ